MGSSVSKKSQLLFRVGEHGPDAIGREVSDSLAEVRRNLRKQVGEPVDTKDGQHPVYIVSVYIV